MDPSIFYLKDLKKNLGVISSRLFNDPSKNLETFAVTGTNGKTSCVELISQIAQLIDYQCGYISTIEVSFDGKAVNHSSPLTTPDPISLQRYFHQMVIALSISLMTDCLRGYVARLERMIIFIGGKMRSSKLKI